MRDAESLLDMCLAYGGGVITAALVRDVLGSTDRAGLFSFAGALLAGDAADALRQIDIQMREGRDAQLFAREVAGHMRALLLAQLMPSELGELLDLTAEDAARYVEQSEGAPQEKLSRIMELFTRSESELRWASQPRTVLELCAVRACHPEREQSIDALLERVAALEARLAKGVAVQPRDRTDADDAAPWGDEPESPPVSAPSEPAPTPAQPAAPKVLQAAASAPPPAWDEALKAISEHDKALYGPLARVHRVDIDGDTARISFLKKDNMFMNLLRQDVKIKQLELRLSEAFGRPMRAVVVEDAPQAAKSASASPARGNIEQVYDVFGRENVSVIDEL